jgi:integrase
MENSKAFSAELFQRRVWVQAMKASNIPYRKQYTTRHTFAGWALTTSTDPNCLVSLMEHASKRMIYETYGKST